MAGKRVIPRERIELTERLFLAGKSRPSIIRRVCKDFGVTARTARNYLARVETRLAGLPRPPAEASFQRAESMLLDAFAKARSAVKVVTWVDGDKKESRIMPAPDTGTMVTAAWRVAELHGVTAPQKVDLTSGGKPIASLTDDELAARVAQRLAALEALRKGDA